MSLAPAPTSYMTTPQRPKRDLPPKNKNSGKLSATSYWIPASHNKKPNKIKGVIDFFKENQLASSMSSVIHKVEERQHLLASIYEALESVNLGSLAQELEPSVISSNGELKLQVSNGAIASRLKQSLPSILKYLQNNNWPIKTLSIKMAPMIKKPVTNLQSNTPLSKKVISESGKRALETLANSLPSDSKVLTSLNQLISKLRKK